MNAPDKPALASRCEQAGGPDREMDRLIVRAAGYSQERMNGRWRWRSASGELLGHTWEPPRLTASIDAITALIAEKLPGYRWQVWSGADGASIWKDDYTKFSDGEGATPALSLVVAFLRALAATKDRTP